MLKIMKRIRVGLLFIGIACLVFGLSAPPVRAATMANGRIFYSKYTDDYLTGYKHIFSSNPDGTNEQRVTSDSQGVEYDNPSVSPDGTKVAYSTIDCNVPIPQIYISISNADGSGARTLVPPAEHQAFTFPSWTPDSSRVVYLGYDFYTNKVTINTIVTDGSDPQTLPIDINATAFYALRGAVAWSANNLIAFVDNGSEIYTVNPDGSNRTNITAEPELTNSAFGDLAWSPDGGKLAFVMNFGCGDGHIGCIETMNADGSNKTFIIGDTKFGDEDWLFVEDPRWSPDGTKLVFSKQWAIKT